MIENNAKDTPLRIFESEEFGEVRTKIIEGEPWFVGKDVAKALGYTRTADAIRTHVDGEDKGVGEIQTPGGKQQATFINESGLYSLIFSSKLEIAKKFKRWVTSDVLPAIRKYGVYATDELLNNQELLLKRTEELKKERERVKQLEEVVKKQTSYVTFAQEYLHRDDRYVTTTTIAKHYGTSAQILNQYLRIKGIQKKIGNTWYMCDENHAQTLGKHIPLYDEYNRYRYLVWEWNRNGELFIHNLLMELMEQC